jgi:hypothetical protein
MKDGIKAVLLYPNSSTLLIHPWIKCIYQIKLLEKKRYR